MGFFPLAHALQKKKLKEMDEGAALDEDLLQVMLLFFFFKKSNSDRYDISCISACLDDRDHLPPRWKIHLIKPQSGSTIIVKLRLWNWRHSFKWHLKLWAFQMDCKVDKRHVTDGPLPVGHLDIFLFLSSAHLQKSSRRAVNRKKNQKVTHPIKLIKVLMLH